MSTPTLAAPPSGTVRRRLRLLACVVVLTGLAFVQSPGLLVPDTKMDLVLAPAEFLGRATHLWDAEGAFGQLQNQAYGYLWPMGPFFLLGWLVDVPGWVVQRLWLALVMGTAFLGTARLARALGVRSEVACIVAGFAFALSPRMLTTMGQISIEAWPGAVAPWVLLALVRGSERGSPRRAAALAGLGVAMVGGVNAAATFAVLPLGAIWVLTRSPGPRRTALMVWWPLFTLLGTLWWLVPLFVMGAYSPPFLDYIESAVNTTLPTTLFDAFRGTSNWVPYVDPTNRAGNDLLRDFYLPIDSGVVLFLGCAGILLRGTQHRLFLGLGVVAGLAMVTMGHTTGVQGWFAGDLFRLLDGVLAPLRNVHKFDPVLRLPLVLGMGFLLDHVVARRRSAPAGGVRDLDALASRLTSTVVVATAVLAVVGAAVPGVLGRITPSTGFQAVPDYWAEAAGWLERSDSSGTALLVPGSAFGTYVWGQPRDEPMQSLAAAPWAVRNAVPLAPPQNIRMLDEVSRQLAQGRGSAALAAYLARAGVTHLVLRNDLTRSNQPDPVLVHQAIDGSEGLERVADFGPTVGGEAHLEGRGAKVVVNGGWQDEHPAIEVYAVRAAASTEGPAYSSSDLPVVVGGAEDLYDLQDLDVLGDEPTRLATDVEEPPAGGEPLVLTDGLRSVERHFARVHDGTSATLTPDDPTRLGPTRDYLPEDAERWLTRARTSGAASVTASSSMADADAFGPLQPGQLPFAAVDRHEETSWRANYVPGEDAWWRLDLEEERTVDSVRITAGPHREVVQVRTAEGVSEPIEIGEGASRTVRLGVSTAWLRVEDASDRVGNQLELAEVEVPGVTVSRSLVLPRLPEEWGEPDVIALRALDDDRTGCAEVDDAVRCVVGRDVAAEEPFEMRRALTLATGGEWEPQLWARPRPSPELDQEIQRGLPIGISATSAGVPDTRARAFAAIDGREGTTWTAAMDGLRPELSLSWLGARRVTGLVVSVAEDTAARAPEELRLSWPGGRRTVQLGRDGRVSFPAIRTDTLRLRVEQAEPATSLDFASVGSDLPIGISELRLTGMPFAPGSLDDQPRRLSCGSGPTLTVNGTSLRTAVVASPVQLYAGARVPVRLCRGSTVTLAPGHNAVDLTSSAVFVPDAVVLRSEDLGLAAPVVASAQRPTPSRVDVRGPLAAGDVVVLRQNANPGWEAEQAGTALEPVVVDGWQQGWVAAGGAEVRAVFTPDHGYRIGLLTGLLALVCLAAVTLVPDRRWDDGHRPAVGAARAPLALVLGVAAVAGGVLAGWAGLVLALVGCLVAAVLGRRAPDSAPWVLAAFVLPAAAAYALRPWGGADEWAGHLDWPHYLVVLVCGFLLGGAAGASGRRGPIPFKRMKGSSTAR